MMDKNEIIPTLTLAKMYEQQEKYKKALEIYKKLNEKESDDFLQKKINYLKDIVEGRSYKQKSIMNQHILSEKEREMFHFKQRDYEKKKEPQMDAAQKSLETIFQKDGSLSDILDGRFTQMQVGDFLDSLASIIGKKRRIKDVTLLEILMAIDRI